MYDLQIRVLSVDLTDDLTYPEFFTALVNTLHVVCCSHVKYFQI
jgi:hypothetical protein